MARRRAGGVRPRVLFECRAVGDRSDCPDCFDVEHDHDLDDASHEHDEHDDPGADHDHRGTGRDDDSGDGSCSGTGRDHDVAAASPPAATVASGTPASLDRISDLEALGDSVAFGTACNCTPYPQLTAAHIAQLTGHAVTGSNDAVAGFVSSDVLHQLQASRTATANVANADAVMIEIGANDIAFSSTCGTNASCYEAKLPQVVKNVTAIVARVRQLTAGHHVTIVLLDYWNVWLGGQVARARGPAYVHAAGAVTDAFSDAIQSIARATGVLYVDLRTTFRGPDHDRDETNLLASDGDHPDAAGQQRIADAVVRKVALA